MSGVDQIRGWQEHDALGGTGTRPVNIAVQILPVIKSKVTEHIVALRVSIIMVQVCHGSNGQLGVRILHIADQRPCETVGNRNACPIVLGVGIILRRPFQNRLHLERQGSGLQTEMLVVFLVDWGPISKGGLRACTCVGKQPSRWKIQQEPPRSILPLPCAGRLLPLTFFSFFLNL